MTAPYGLLDQSAIARLLASKQRSADMPQTPQMGGLLAPPLPAPVPFNPNATPPIDDPSAHVEGTGLLGRLRHAIGSDRIAPELGALLTPDQRERVKPGLLATVGNAILTGRGPQAVAQSRAQNLLGLQDTKKERDKQARDERLWGNIQEVAGRIPGAQERLEFVARTASAYGLPQAEQAALAAQRLEAPRVPTDEPQILRGVPDPANPGKFVMQGLGRTGNVIWEKPDAGTEATSDLRKDLRFQRMTTRAQPLANSFQRETERHQVVAEALTTMDGLRTAALAGDGPAQHMLVFSLMKLADPGSAVRQDERADTKNAANVPEQLRAAWNRYFDGGGSMSEHTVRQFLATADATKAARLKDFDRLREQFDKRARIIDVDPELVTSDYFANLRSPSPASVSRETSVSSEGKPMSAAAYKAARDAGYTDAEIRRQGYRIPEGG